jgi:hypothetical protein
MAQLGRLINNRAEYEGDGLSVIDTWLLMMMLVRPLSAMVHGHGQCQLSIVNGWWLGRRPRLLSPRSLCAVLTSLPGCFIFVHVPGLCPFGPWAHVWKVCSTK